MAADQRQFTEHNEIGGANVYYEDKRMEELKSATGKTASQISTTDEYIPLQDTDGNLVKINPASFQEAVRNVLGSLLANNDKGTTISGIPALSGSGASLDFGSVTPANLASVLGVNSIANRVYVKFLDAGTTDTGISVNGAGGGRTILVLGSGSWDTDDRSCSFIWLLRCGYSGNHVTKEVVKEMNMDQAYTINVGVTSDGNLKFTTSHSVYSVMLIRNK